MNIKKVANTLGIDICGASIGMQAYTECDTVSAFAGKGKAKVLEVCDQMQVSQSTLLHLSHEWDILHNSWTSWKHLHANYMLPRHQHPRLINHLRYHLF